MQRYNFDPSSVDVIPLAREVEVSRDATSIEDVAAALHAIEPTLEPAGIQDDFHHIYTLVSDRVAAAKQRGEFQRPEMVDATSPVFLGYYTKPLGQIADFVQSVQHEGHGNPNALEEMKRCWWLTLVDPRLAGAPRGQRTALGISSHIIADLGFSMGHTKPGKDYFPDYMNVVTRTLNGVIVEEIAKQVPAHPISYKVLVPSISRGIAAMRHQSWRDYERLRRTPTDQHAALERTLDYRATLVNQTIHAVGPTALTAMARTEGLQSLAGLGVNVAGRLRPGLTKAIQTVVNFPSKFL